MPTIISKYPPREVYLKRDSKTLIQLMEERFKSETFFGESLFQSEWFYTNAELIRWAFKEQNKKQVYNILKEKISARNITAEKMKSILQGKIKPFQKKYFFIASELLPILKDENIIKGFKSNEPRLYFELLFCLYNGRLGRFKEIIYQEESTSSLKDFFNHHIFSFDSATGKTGNAVQRDFAEPYVPFNYLPAQAGTYMDTVHELSYKIDVLERFILGDEYFVEVQVGENKSNGRPNEDELNEWIEQIAKRIQENDNSKCKDSKTIEYYLQSFVKNPQATRRDIKKKTQYKIPACDKDSFDSFDPKTFGNWEKQLLKKVTYHYKSYEQHFKRSYELE